MKYTNHAPLHPNLPTRHLAPAKGAAGVLVKPSKVRRIIQTAAAALLLGSAIADAQVVLQPNEANSKDAKVYGFLPTNNFQSNLGIIGSDSAPHFFYALLQFTEVNAMWVPRRCWTMPRWNSGCRRWAALGPTRWDSTTPRVPGPKPG